MSKSGLPSLPRAVEQRVYLALSGLRGRACLESLARELARASGSAFGYVARVSGAGEQTMLAHWARNAFGPGMTYEIGDTPCEKVHMVGAYEVTEGVAKAFPEDAWLSDEGIEGFLGVLVRCEDSGEATGVLGLLRDEPTRSSPGLQRLMERLAPRVNKAFDEIDEDAALAKQSMKARRVLLVEGNPAVRVLLDRSLKEMHHAAEAVADAEHALFCARRSPPDLLVLDTELPLGAAKQLAADVRAERPDLTLLLIGGGAEELDVSVDARLPKPFAPDEFVRAVQELL